MSRYLAATVGFGWVSVGYAAKSAAHLLALVVLSRALTKSAYGEVTLIFAFYNLLWSSIEVGIGYTVVRLPTAKYFFLETIYTISILFGILIFMLFLTLSPFITYYFSANSITYPIILIGIGVLFRSISIVAEFLLYKESKFGNLAQIDVVCYLVFAIVLITFVVLDYAFWAMPSAQFAYMVCKSILVMKLSPHKKALRIHKRALKPIFNYFSGFGGASLLSAATAEADKFIVGRVLSLQVLGAYGRATQLFMLPASVLGQAADYVLTSLLAKERRNPIVQARAVYGASSVMALVMLPASVVVWLLAPEIVDIVLGQRWNEVAQLLRILCISMFFRVSMKIFEAVLRARGMVWVRMRAYLVYFTFLLIALAVGAYWFGLTGVVWATTLCNIIFYALMFETIRSTLELSWFDIGKTTIRGLSIASVVLIISFPLLELTREFEIPSPYILIAYSSISISLGMVALHVVGSRALFGEHGHIVFYQIIKRIGIKLS